MNPKTYKSAAAAKKAIKDAGLGAMTVRYDKNGGRFGPLKDIIPVVLCDLPEDVVEVRNRGFHAEIKRRQIEEGATVRLTPEASAKKNRELAVVIGFLTEKAGGGIVLDRPLEGVRHWSQDSLELIERENSCATDPEA